MRTIFTFAILLLLSFTNCAESYNILCFFPTVSRSQVIFANPILLGLAQKGHNVTLVSSFSMQKNVANYHEIIVSIDFTSHSKLTSSIAKEERSGNPLVVMTTLVHEMMEATNETLNHPNFKKLLNSGDFDGVIHGFAMNLFQVGIAVHFDCPSIILSSVPLIPPLADLLGHPINGEAVPNILLNVKANMSFFQRVANMLVNALVSVFNLYQEYVNKQYYDVHFPRDKYPSYEEAKKNIALLLLNEHFSQGIVRPLLPNAIEVSGLQMTDKVGPLPDDIRPFIEGASDGLVFVSFGTNVRSADLTLEKREAFLKAFAKLKQRVLWKYEDDSLSNLPSNVMIKKWLPQNDILAHPNTKVFVSHMGIGGYNEAMYHAVPVLAIPFAGDQFANGEKAENEGWAEVIPYPELTQEGFTKTLNKLLNEKKYKNAVQKLSDLYRDRPMSAIDLAMFWIEYVIKHKGAKHLRYPGVELNFFQRTSLDVFAFLFVVAYVVFKVFGFCLKKLLSLCCKSSKNTQKRKKE